MNQARHISIEKSGETDGLSNSLLRTSRDQIKKLHLQIKAAVKSRIKTLQENPFAENWLEKDLSGYLSIRVKRFRVIYRINEDKRIVEIHHVGHRKDIYELFKESLLKD